MKKLLLIALAALSVSVAKAVTLSPIWSADSLSNSTIVSLSTTVTTTRSALLVATVTYPDINQTGFTMSLVPASGYSNRVSIEGSEVDGSGTGGVGIAVLANDLEYFDQQTYSVSGLSDGASLQVAVVLTQDGTTSAAAFYYNGENVLTVEQTGLIEADATLSRLIIGSSSYDITDAALYVEDTTNEILAAYTALATSYTTIVPEPTVLALLALGVAGLALKRKVA